MAGEEPGTIPQQGISWEDEYHMYMQDAACTLELSSDTDFVF